MCVTRSPIYVVGVFGGRVISVYPAVGPLFHFFNQSTEDYVLFRCRRLLLLVNPYTPNARWSCVVGVLRNPSHILLDQPRAKSTPNPDRHLGNLGDAARWPAPTQARPPPPHPPACPPACPCVCVCARACVKEAAARDNCGKAGERLGTRRRSERD